MEWLSDDGYDYTGAMCSECGRSLDRNGYCTHPRCPYEEYRQDEAVPVSVRREKQQLVGNPRSKRAYVYGTKGYRRNLASPHAVIFAEKSDAEAAGYEIHDE